MAITLYDKFRAAFAERAPNKLTVGEASDILRIPIRKVLEHVHHATQDGLITRDENERGTRFAYYMTTEQASAHRAIMEGKKPKRDKRRDNKPPAPARPRAFPVAPAIIAVAPARAVLPPPPHKPRPAPAPAPKPEAPRKPHENNALPKKKPVTRAEGEILMRHLEAMEVTQRLKFLYHLRDRSIFNEWQLLHEIIRDYELTLQKLTN